jgi:hypothetical protein
LTESARQKPPASCHASPLAPEADSVASALNIGIGERKTTREGGEKTELIHFCDGSELNRLAARVSG